MNNGTSSRMDANQESIATIVDVEDVRDGFGAGVDTSVGAMLRKRRIALGLSQADVANVVKLPARRIEAMEQERWDELPDGPYLRGFLKNIARALNLDAATLIDRVDESLMRARNPDSILVAPGSTHAMLPRRSGPAEGRHSGRALVIGALVFAMIAALIAWSGTDSFDRAVVAGKSWIEGRRAPVAGSTSSSAVASPTPELKTKTELVQSSPTVPTSIASETELRDATSPNAGPVASNGNAAMQFHFSEDAWVEVRGADGKVLLSRLNAAGTEQAVEGAPPFNLVVGNARAVRLSYRGQPVDLIPYTRDQVARFTLS